MANLILPRRLQNQPQGRQRLNLDCGVPWGNDTEIFLAGATPGVHLVGTEQQPRRVGSLSLQYQNLNGLNTAYTTSTSGGTVSAKVIVPPSSLSIFAVMASRIDWRDATANNFVGGFTKSGTSSGAITAAYGGDAAMGLAFGTEEPVTPFRGVPAGLALTYSDGTSEMIRTGFDGIAKNNRDTWFVGVSFKDASEYVTFAKNLRTGESFSSVTATTKSLKQVEQPFQAFCSLPFLSTTWARNCSQAGVYVGYSGAAFDVDTFGRMAQDPWQIFRAKPRTFYFDAAIGGGSDTSLVVSDTPHIHTAEAVAVASSSLLTVAGDASSHAAEVVGVTSVSAIVVGAASHGHTAENSVLQTTGAAGLVVADGVHNHTSVAPLITAASQMTVNEATHNSVNDFVSFTTADYLAIANSNSASDADATVLSLPGMEALLVIANAANSHTADSVVVGSAHVLNVFNALNAHIAVSIEVGVTSNTLLEILGAIHTHTADASLGLTCATTLAILENILEHNSTSPVITSWDGFITTKRAYTVVAENRSYIVMLEDRSHTVMTENRMYAVPVD